MDNNEAPDRAYEKQTTELFLDKKRDAAIRFIDSVYASGNVSPLGLHNMYMFKSRYYHERQDHAHSLLYADSAIGVLRQKKLEHKYEKEFSHALLEKARIYTDLNKYDSAYDSYMEGYSFVYATGNTCYLHEFDHGIGLMLYRQYKNEEARIFFKRSFIEATACTGDDKPYYRMQELLSNIGLTYYNDSCIYFFDSCLSFIEKNTGRFHSREMEAEAKAVCLLNKGHAYEMMGRYSDAEKPMHKALDIYTAMDGKKYRSHIIRSRMALAMMYYYAKDRKKLRQVWNEIEPLLDTAIDIPLRIAGGQLRYAVYEVEGDYKSAYEALDKYVEFIDSVRRGTQKDEQAGVLQVMKNKEQEYKIELLTRDARLQRTYLGIAAIVSVLAIVILILIYTGYKRTKRSNKLISEQKTALEKSNREKNKILNIVAHDLRSPVSAVAYMAETIIEDGEDATMEPIAALKMIRTSSLSSLQLINELSVFARNEQGELSLQKTDMATVLQEAIDLQAQNAAEKKVEVKLTLPTLPVEARVDKNKMIRLVANLLHNAIKFSAPGAEVHVALQKDSEGVRFLVQDAGIGIPARLLPDLFEMFTPSGRTGTKGERSFGLGLSICRQIVEAHRGKIWVESTEGKGSTFYVQLPLV
ncbi:hypothetical protein GCM10023093_02040 [Nemorincola caseinilytica]|uniref:histidine kinase n=2 Tax=Nemorincola caseinilytica TaxID=2054315 RepID=A0ABP8N5P8_9BACT